MAKQENSKQNNLQIMADIVAQSNREIGVEETGAFSHFVQILADQGAVINGEGDAWSNTLSAVLHMCFKLVAISLVNCIGSVFCSV